MEPEKEDFKKQQSAVSNATERPHETPKCHWIWHFRTSAHCSPSSKVSPTVSIFKEFIHFTKVVGSVGITLFVIYSDCLVNTCHLCHRVSSFSPDIVRLGFLSSLDPSCKEFIPHPFDMVTVADV